MKVFISYRRDDSRSITDRIYSSLSGEWGRANIFRDTDSIMPGADFRTALREAISSADVVLLVIGPRWLEMTDESGRRRIDNPDDYVRLEITLAFELEKQVIPILVDQTRIPAPSELPGAIRELSFRNAIVLRSESFDFEIRILQRHLKAQQEQREGYCYLNREGIDELCTKYGIVVGREPSYGRRIHSLIQYLDTQNLLSMEARPGDQPFALITSKFKFIEDDEEYISFRAQPYGFYLNMNKMKSTFWPYKSVMNRLSHVRIALNEGVELWVFGQWYASTYLRPHAASVVGFNLRMNDLF